MSEEHPPRSDDDQREARREAEQHERALRLAKRAARPPWMGLARMAAIWLVIILVLVAVWYAFSGEEPGDVPEPSEELPA